MVTYSDIKRETMGNRRDTFAFIKLEDLQKITPGQWDNTTEIEITLDEWEEILKIMQLLGKEYGHITILPFGGAYFRSNIDDKMGIFLTPCLYDE